MFINSYFPTVIWSEEKPEFVKSLNKASNKYIIDLEGGRYGKYRQSKRPRRRRRSVFPY